MELTKVFEAFKLAPRILFGVALASGVAVFSPEWLVAYLGFQDLLKQHRSWIGAAFVVSAALLVSALLASVGEYLAPLVRERLQIRISRGALKRLSRPEKQLLANYFRLDTTTLAFDITNGVAGGLAAKGIIYRASNMGRGTSFDFNLQPWAWTYLSRHPQLIGINSIAEAASEQDARFR